jgi:hypothetical protein
MTDVTLSILSLATQSPLLHLCKGTASAKEENQANNASDGQGLEQVPARVVLPEDKLHAGDATNEQRMADGCGGKGFGQVIEIGAKQAPDCEEDGQGSEDRKGEDQSDDLGRRLGVRSEDVVNLGQGAVASNRTLCGYCWDREGEDLAV